MLDLKELRTAVQEVLDNITSKSAQVWYDDVVMRIYMDGKLLTIDDESNLRDKKLINKVIKLFNF